MILPSLTATAGLLTALATVVRLAARPVERFERIPALVLLADLPPRFCRTRHLAAHHLLPAPHRHLPTIRSVALATVPLARASSPL